MNLLYKAFISNIFVCKVLITIILLVAWLRIVGGPISIGPSLGFEFVKLMGPGFCCAVDSRTRKTAHGV